MAIHEKLVPFRNFGDKNKGKVKLGEFGNCLVWINFGEQNKSEI